MPMCMCWQEGAGRTKYMMIGYWCSQMPRHDVFISVKQAISESARAPSVELQPTGASERLRVNGVY